MAPAFGVGGVKQVREYHAAPVSTLDGPRVLAGSVVSQLVFQLGYVRLGSSHQFTDLRLELG